MSSVLAQAFSSKLFRGSYNEVESAVAFDFQGSKQEKKRLASFVNRIAKSSPFGKQVLEDAAKGGFSLSFGMQMGSFGYCVQDKKAIVLDPVFSDSRLISVLAHEARHAQQFSNGADENFGQRTIKSELMYFRSMEADAETAAAMTSLELRAAGDTGPWESFKKGSPEIAMKLRFFEGRKAFRATEGAMMSAFDGWFEDPMIKEAYEKSYIVNTMNKAKKKKEYDKMPYNKVETSADIVSLLCRTPSGGCYFENKPDVLNDSSKLDISVMTYSEMDNFFALRQKFNGMKPDRSYKNLDTRVSMSSYVGQYSSGVFDSDVKSLAIKNKMAARGR